MSHLFVFGYGYSARRIGEEALRLGWRVSGTRRSAEGVAELEAMGISGHVFGGDAPSPGVGARLATASHVLVSTPPQASGDPVLRHHRPDVVASESLEWIGYLSTTGVYGDREGAWVDESSRPRPETSRSRMRLAAERGWREVATEADVPLQIFRLSGIYGAGRSALDRLRDGTARSIVSPDVVFNRIHVDDIAGAVVAGMRHPRVVGVLNVSDDEPAPPADVYAHAAELMGRAPPPPVPLDEAELSPAARSFYEENKRVRSTRLATELGYALRHPTYREGLASILAAEAESGP
ncbi:MAG: SDR family oxidoreductase [Longimicrobiales bacterium]|nr:SDR family oxidoreductase [Longimicrobiales bacterium]